MMYAHINSLFKLNCLKPVIGAKYPLEETSKAHHDVIFNQGTTGRLTLVVQDWF